MNKLFTVVAACATLALTLTGCSDQDKQAKTAGAPGKAAVVLTIGASPVPHADILKFVSPELKKQGIELKVIEFSDYVKPNLALSDKELDANFFQHIPYLESFSKERGLKLRSLCAVHIEPMGVYSRTAKDLKTIAAGAKVAIPNDPTNGGRALKVLADAGFFSLKPGTGVNGTPADIINNKYNIRIVEMEAAVLPRALEDLTYAVINSNFAMGVGLNPAKDALFTESKDSPYANIVAVRSDDTREALTKLAAALQNAALRDFIMKTYKGAVLPAF